MGHRCVTKNPMPLLPPPPQYYQVPRIWLVGYNEAKQPLTPKQVGPHFSPLSYRVGSQLKAHRKGGPSLRPVFSQPLAMHIASLETKRCSKTESCPGLILPQLSSAE